MRIQSWVIAIVCLATLAAGNPRAWAPGAARAATTASPVPSARASAHAATATAIPGPLERARIAYDGIAAGTLDRSTLSPELASELSAARLATLSAALEPLGAPQSFTLVGTHGSGGATTYDFSVRYAAGGVTFTYGFNDATHLVDKLYVRTARS